jgi:hypothetical protein
MKINYLLINTLPKLSWCAIINLRTKECTVYHGNEVEVHNNFFAEGAWNEDFSAAGLTKATTLCGTAACNSDGGIRFFSSTDTLSPLFSVHIEADVFISNSPFFTLSASELEPDPLHPFYAYDFVRVFQSGLNCSAGHLPTNSKYPLKIHFQRILAFDSNCNFSILSFPPTEVPIDYLFYKSTLEKTVKAVVNNGKSTNRSVKYDPLVLVSKGYDSVAIACLAAQAGCKDAVTFIDYRKRDPYQDSGKDVAEMLGMSCLEYDRWGHLNYDEPIESEFAFSTISVNPSSSLMSNQLPAKILFSGSLSAVAWEYSHSILAKNNIRPKFPHISAFSQIEYRLKLGYQVFIPAMICVEHNQKLATLSISEAMKPWSVGGDYDKPIARRIAEENGIPREAFGFKKMSSSQAHFYKVSDFSKKGLAEYEHFLSHHLSKVPLHKIWMNKLLVKLEKFIYLLWFSNHKDMSCLNPNRFRFTALDGKRHDIPWRLSFMFQWAFNSLKSRYTIPENLKIKKSCKLNGKT